MKKSKNVRLSSLVIPQHYVLILAPDLKNFTFQGQETLEIMIKKETNQIVLHAKDLVINKVIFAQNKKVFQAKKVIYDTQLETATFVFPQKLSKGAGKLSSTFQGELNDKMLGFYRSKYEVNGKQEYMAVTQLESTHARWVFPCFDEPALKATFAITLIVKKELTVISNTIEEKIEEYDALRKKVQFVKTPKMSTYLLAFIVGKFDHIESKTSEGVLVRVFVSPGKKKLAEFALDTGVKILSFYTKYFKFKYPLPVMDMVAIPDFAAGAMENWGAVTYRETALLVDPLHSAVANKQRVAMVIAHELAHQWFGNLVTMQWWTHLWLNEGFASFIEFLAVDHVFPKWHIWKQFVFSEHSRALELDSLKNTHPIEIHVQDPHEINEIFDAVSYSKGASIIRMLAEYLGQEVFKKGLQHYLRKHAYKNTTTEDLWQALEFVSKKPVRTIMKNWTQEPGYPLVTLEKKKGKMILSQQRFFSSTLSGKQNKKDTTWNIAMLIKNSSRKNVEPYLLDKKISVFKQGGSDSWVKLNAHETSFIRVSYPPSYIRLFQKPIRDKLLGSEDRFGIIRDAFALSEAGYTATSRALELVSHYKEEDEFTVWAEITVQLHKVENLIEREPFYTNFRVYARDVYKTIAHDLGWNARHGESESQTLLRSLALYNEGRYGNPEVIAHAQKLFQTKVLSSNSLASDLRGIVYMLVAENGTEVEYRQFMKLYDQADLAEEKDRIFRALCSFSQTHLLQQSLEFSLSPKVRAQDSFKAFYFVFAHPQGKNLAWEFVQKHWDMLVERFSGSHLLPRFISAAESFVSQEEATEIEAFFKTHKAPSAERTIAQTIEQIRSNAAWLARDRTAIADFLLQNSHNHS